MGDTFVIFPGTTGNYIDSDDVNLLDADTAHFHQSIGNWTAGAGASTLTHDTGGTPTPQYGDGLAKATTDGTGAVIATLITPTLTAVAHAIAIDIYTDTADREAFITLDGTNGTVVALTAGQWSRVTVTKTPTAGTKTVNVTYRKTDNTDPAASEEVWLGKANLQLGATAVFVPSMRITGDRHYAYDFQPVDITNGTERWLSNGDASSDHSVNLDATARIRVRFLDDAGTAFLTHSTDFAAGMADDVRGVLEVKATANSAGPILFEWNSVQWRSVPTGPTTGAYWGGAQDLGAILVGARSASVAGPAMNLFSFELRDGFDGPVVRRLAAEDVASAL